MTKCYIAQPITNNKLCDHLLHSKLVFVVNIFIRQANKMYKITLTKSKKLYQ